MIHADAGFGEFRQQLQGLLDRADDLRPVLTDIGEDVQLVIEEGFESGRRPLGRRWSPLAKEYARTRVRKGRGRKVLELKGGRGGMLRKSLTGGKASVFDLSRTEVRVGSKLGIAPPHHKGFSRTIKYPNGRRKRFKIPARPLLPSANSLRGRYDDSLRSWLVDGDRGGGL